MKRKTIPLAAMIAAAFAGSAALAQTQATTPTGATPTPRDLAATTAAAGSAPATRAEVKAATKAPVDVPRGEAQTSKKHRKGGAVEPKTDGEERADVKAETESAAKAGEIPRGEAALSGQHPRGGAVAGTSGTKMGTTAERADVKAGAAMANRSGDIPKGEAEVKIKP